MKHTPEPWELKHDYTPEGGYYKITKQGDYWPIIPESSCNENFSRIVACVNACAGMDDPAAEIERLRAERENAEDNVRMYKELCRIAEQERDKLLEALELFTILNPNHYRDIAGLINKAVEVVNKMKGINL